MTPTTPALTVSTPLAIAIGLGSVVAAVAAAAGLWWVLGSTGTGEEEPMRRNPSPAAPPAPPRSPEPAVVSRLSALQPAFRERLDRVLEALRARGFEPWVFETLRSPERQLWLYHHRPGSTQTWRSGPHGQGFAADIIDGRLHPDQARRPGMKIGWGSWKDEPDAGPTDQVAYAMSRSFFAALGQEAKRQGLEWGGDWRGFADMPHVQLPSTLRSVA